MDKKKISNEKRLQAVKAWKTSQRNVGGYCGTSGKHMVFSAAEEEEKNKLKLFDSDSEEDKCDDSFSIRPQFEGPRGQQLLERSSELPSRFKLDERFKDDDQEQSKAEEENDEIKKNLKILESVLGHEVSAKYSEGKNFPKKRQLMRFDPDDENASKYLKISEFSDEKIQKKIQEKKCDKNISNDIPISSERYTEISCSLKDVLNSSSAPFTLSEKFSSNEKPLADESHRNEFISSGNTEVVDLDSSIKIDAVPKNEKPIIFGSKVFKKESFFVPEGDPRLKEGVEFFMCLKPLDVIREEWKLNREAVLEIFRKRKRSSQKRHTNKVQNAQRKYAFRKAM